MKKSFGFWVLIAITVGAFIVVVFGNLSDKQQLTAVAVIGTIWLVRYNDKHQEWLSDTFAISNEVSAEERTRIFQREVLRYLFEIVLGVFIISLLLIYIVVTLE